MVLYFSATGNTEYIAKEVARLIGDECLNLSSKIKNSDYSEIKSEKPFVVCAPVYVCELPNFMKRFLKRIKLTGSNEMYFILSSGGYSGCACVNAKSICRKQRMIYKGSADIVMPRNYIASNLYPMQPAQEMLDSINAAKEKITEAARIIQSGAELKMRHVYLFEVLIIIPVAYFWIHFVIKAKKFYVKDSCIGCGKCEKLCPLNVISIKENRPVWNGKCTHCMACISNCPKDSIEYGNITEGKERYLFKKIYK